MSRPSLIPGGMTVEGELEGKGDLVVLGRVLGPISIEGLLIIEEGGAVRGVVNASSVVVRGVLVGDALAQESVRLESTAQVVGDLRGPRVKVADGARLKGRVHIGADASMSSVVQRPMAVAPVAPAALAAPAPLRPAVAAPIVAPVAAPVPTAVRAEASQQVTAVRSPDANADEAPVPGPRVRRSRIQARLVPPPASSPASTAASTTGRESTAAKPPTPAPKKRASAGRPRLEMPRLGRVAAARR